MFRKGARLFWSSKKGGLKPGLQCGYAVTAFDSELELRSAVQNFSYTELLQVFKWKVGTAEITEPRLETMFKIKRPLKTAEDIWDRYYVPFTERLSQYASNTKNFVADNDEFQKEVLVKKYIENEHIAILMVPLIIAFDGTDKELELQMSRMIVRHGGEVWNNKDEQKKKDRAKNTQVQMRLPDRDPDKLLKLTPTLAKLKFEIHPTYKGRK